MLYSNLNILSSIFRSCVCCLVVVVVVVPEPHSPVLDVLYTGGVQQLLSSEIFIEGRGFSSLAIESKYSCIFVYAEKDFIKFADDQDIIAHGLQMCTAENGPVYK